MCAAPSALTVSAAPPTGRRKINLWSSPGRGSHSARCLFFLRKPCSDGSCFEVIASQSQLVCRCTLRSSQRMGRWADCLAVAKVVGGQWGGVSRCPGTVCRVHNTSHVEYIQSTPPILGPNRFISVSVSPGAALPKARGLEEGGVRIGRQGSGKLGQSLSSSPYYL